MDIGPILKRMNEVVPEKLQYIDRLDRILVDIDYYSNQLAFLEGVRFMVSGPMNEPTPELDEIIETKKEKLQDLIDEINDINGFSKEEIENGKGVYVSLDLDSL